MSSSLPSPIRVPRPLSNSCKLVREPEQPMVAEESVAAALTRAGVITSRDGVIVVTGSIFLVGEAMRAMGIPA